MDASTIVAICALITSVFSVGLAVWTASLQRKHMRLSVKPIAAIPVADFEHRVGVFLKNCGLGPMLVLKFRVFDMSGNITEDLVSQMPCLENGILWSNFHIRINGSVIEQGKRLELLLLEGDINNNAFVVSRDRIRKRLSELIITVEYEDLYGQKMGPHTDNSLTFFGRHFAIDKNI
jgi:hypothetical protein